MLADSQSIEVCPPDLQHRGIILNLGIYFRYDLLPFVEDGEGSNINPFGVIGDDAVATLEQSIADQGIWWTKPGILLPMLIRVGAEPAGFAQVARPPHAHRSVDYRMEDFFIANKFRRMGVGRAAAAEVFNRYPGKWEIGWLPKNNPAEQFWRSVTKQWHAEDWPVSQAPDKSALPGLLLNAE